MHYSFDQLVNLEHVRNLLQSHNGFSNMAYGLFDINDNILLTVGWQDICTQFHRVHPVSSARCHESDAYMRSNLSGIKGEYLEYHCRNGMVDMVLPIIVEGIHLATFFTGQFFYEDELPDRGFFIAQADEFGFDQDSYLAAFDHVPVFSRAHIHSNMLFLQNMVEVLAESGFAKLKLMDEMEKRSRIEDALAAREQEFRTLLENAVDPIYRYDAECRRVYVNPAVERISGVSASRLLGKTPVECALVSSTESVKVLQSLRRVLKTGRSEDVELRFIVPDGSERFFQNRHVPEFGADGTVVTVLSIGRDITERKQYERELLQRAMLQEQLSAVAAAVPGFIFTTRIESDGHTTFPYASPGIVELLGLNPEEIRDNAAALRARYHPDDLPRLFELIAESRETGGAFRYELRIMHPVYGLRWIEMRSTVQLQPDGVAVAHGVMIDITERKKMEDELQRKNSELERFTYTVSHDLKSPLITIKSFSGSIKHDLSANRFDRVEKDLDRISAAANKMTVLLDDLLKLSRVGHVITPPEPVDMDRLVHDVLKDLDGVLRESKVQISVEPGLPSVRCDRQRMSEVLQNLIENGIKYRGEQLEPHIVIGMRKDGEQQVFFVQDNGPGIAPKYHENIFGLFNRLHTNVPGTGVGLALVKRIVAIHGGNIWVESDGLGNGSRFCFTVGNQLPLTPR